MNNDKSFWCSGCGEPKYKCYCDEICDKCKNKSKDCLDECEGKKDKCILV